MMLHILILCGKDLFSMWFIAWFKQKYISLRLFHVCETQRTRMHVTDTTATSDGHQMAVVTWDRSIETVLSVIQHYQNKYITPAYISFHMSEMYAYWGRHRISQLYCLFCMSL